MYSRSDILLFIRALLFTLALIAFANWLTTALAAASPRTTRVHSDAKLNTLMQHDAAIEVAWPRFRSSRFMHSAH